MPKTERTALLIVFGDWKHLREHEIWYILHDADKYEVLMLLVMWSVIQYFISQVLSISSANSIFFILNIHKEKKKDKQFTKVVLLISFNPPHIFLYSILFLLFLVPCRPVLFSSFPLPICFFATNHHHRRHIESFIFVAPPPDLPLLLCLQGLRTACDHLQPSFPPLHHIPPFLTSASHHSNSRGAV